MIHVADGFTEAGQPEEHDARVRLAALQARAAGAYAAITAADEVLRALARRRVSAERAARQAAVRHQATARAAAAHARARPGTVAQLATGFRAGREWREKAAALDAALADAERLLADARRVLTRTKDEFAAQLQVRAEAAAALRRLTAECAAARDELAGQEKLAGQDE